LKLEARTSPVSPLFSHRGRCLSATSSAHAQLQPPLLVVLVPSAHLLTRPSSSLQGLLAEGLALIDDGAPNTERLYWFPALSDLE